MPNIFNVPDTDPLESPKIKLPNGVTMIDTPGLINRGQVTPLLRPRCINPLY